MAMKVKIIVEGADGSEIVISDQLAAVGRMRSIPEIEQFVEDFRLQMLAQMEQQLIQASEAVLAGEKNGGEAGV
jgi:ribosome-binding factor A